MKILAAILFLARAFGQQPIGASLNATVASGQSSLTLTAPANAVVGSFLLAEVCTSGGKSPGVAPPLSWVIVIEIPSTQTFTWCGVYAHRLLDGEHSFTWSSIPVLSLIGAIAAFSGVDSNNPIQAVAHAESFQIEVPVTSPGLMALFYFSDWWDVGNYNAVPAAVTSGGSISSNDTSLWVGWMPVQAGTVTTWLNSSYSLGEAIAVVLNPASVITPPPPCNKKNPRACHGQ